MLAGGRLLLAASKSAHEQARLGESGQLVWLVGQVSAVRTIGRFNVWPLGHRIGEMIREDKWRAASRALK